MLGDMDPKRAVDVARTSLYLSPTQYRRSQDMERRRVEMALRDESEVTKSALSRAQRTVDRYRGRTTAHRITLAATQVATEALNSGSLAAMREAETNGETGGRRKFWNTAADEKVRDAHVAIALNHPDGVPLDQPFLSPLGPIDHPGDSDASLENILNCRCYLTYN
jgi:hypothetical protein